MGQDIIDFMMLGLLRALMIPPPSDAGYFITYSEGLFGLDETLLLLR